MSDEENAPPVTTNFEKLPVVLGVPEKQPRDLGVHKIVFNGRDQPIGEYARTKEGLAESITIVQDEYCGREKEGERKNKEVRNRLISASIICLIFIALEFAGGYFSNSLVIAADAAQLLTVFSTMMVSLFAIRVSGRRPNSASGFTWYQVEAVVALASVLVTWVLTSIVMYVAYQRLVKEKFEIDVDMMLATSAFGVVANLVMGMVLHNNCHVRSCHGVHDPAEAPIVNVNVRAAFLHIVCDFLFSLGVFITALFIDCCVSNLSTS
ncbi:proton-coupled zinc antiporter SLC30A2-like [Macrosteles quadrilineatus]|uniref:proton-coupled zinc antiporter SLC30A2-like n=1 Tax=Macrosteles quadrilineatus TaxID=74068 RepID=UPI0023E21B46|nr:proton-coupled zinc antiporter SLC30A2-like [Macrosteles quadrilineatus]